MMRILFHGTSHDVTEFNEDSIGLGQDPNSSLGAFVTDAPYYAVEYALRSMAMDEKSNEPVVLVVSYLPDGQESIFHHEEFYGDHDDGTNTKEHFSQLRSDMLDNGIDLIDFEGSEEAITALLVPKKIKIIDRLPTNKAIALSEYLDEKGITWKMPNEILEAIEFIKNQ